jgi:hypothetical protein
MEVSMAPKMEHCHVGAESYSTPEQLKAMALAVWAPTRDHQVDRTNHSYVGFARRTFTNTATSIR